MKRDDIVSIGIDSESRLWVKPQHSTFPYVYREALQVNWDVEGGYLYSPPPREWGYLQWLQQIIAASRAQSWELCITRTTQWESVPTEIRRELEEWLAGACG